MTGALGWLVRRLGGMTLATLLLFGIALASVAWGLSRIVRGLDVDLLVLMLVAGASVGWLLARSSWRGRVVLPFALLIAIFTVFARVGQLGDELLAFALALGKFLWQLEYRYFDPRPLGNAFDPILSGVTILITRLDQWVGAIVSGQPVQDLVALALAWSFVVWLIAAWSAWTLRRNFAPFVAILPLLIFFGLVLAITGRETWLLIFPLAALLGLSVIVAHHDRRTKWEREQIPSADDLGFDLGLIAVPAIFGIIALVFLIPPFSPREIARWVQEWSQPAEQTTMAFSNSFGLEPAPRATTVLDTLSSPGLPRSHLLGASPELLERVALIIQTDDASGQSLPYYWRSSTYDIYTGHGWVTSRLQMESYNANDRAQADPPGARTLYQTIHPSQMDGLVYAAGNLFSVDHAFQIAWRTDHDLFAAQTRASEYRVASNVQSFSAADLRATSTNYPSWIQIQYIALSEDIPPRVLALARDLTATAPTPYDRALAIENYLRTIPYTLELPAPPPDRDVVDYFLFDLKRGYCDYYATAMAVLARAAGLPARVAVGYATGDYDAARGEYIVTEANAHSWTQIYFPEYGWVDFEPTSARAAINYDQPTALISPTPPHETGEASGVPSPGNLQLEWYLIPLALLILLFALLSTFLLEVVRLGQMRPEDAISLLFQKIFHLARKLDLPVTASDTPHQVLAQWENYLNISARPKKFAARFRSAGQTLADIVELYVRATYGAYAISPSDRTSAVRHWLRVRGWLWLALVLHVFQKRSLSLLRVPFRAAPSTPR